MALCESRHLKFIPLIAAVATLSVLVTEEPGKQ